MREQRQTYPSDLTEAEWNLIADMIPMPKQGGRPAKYDRREIVNGILYVLRSGCSWRMMPHDLPAWDSVFGYFNRWKKAGVWEKIHQTLYSQMREQLDRNPEATAGIADSQSVKTTEKGG